MKSKTTVRVIARTFELQELADRAHMSVHSLTDGMMKDFDILSGRAAGVCYMPEDYFESELYSGEKSLKRAESTARRGHASVFDHAHMTLLIETNKMMAMILNSLGVYTTSEKSARYTKMKPETQEEKEIYTKWIGKLQKEILKQYTFIDDDMLSSRFCKELGIEKSKAVINGSISHIKDDEYMEEILSNLKRSETLPSYKLAQENARYMISVFTPTVMEYTLSYRQLFLIIDYLGGLSLNLVYADDKFSKKLKPYVEDLKNSLMSIVDNVRLHDTKNQYIRFLEAQHVGHIVSKEESRVEYTEYLDIEERLKQKKEVIGDSYTLVYNGSLAMLAQAQRHRTLRYTMCLQEPGERGFYVPEIVKKAGLEKFFFFI